MQQERPCRDSCTQRQAGSSQVYKGIVVRWLGGAPLPPSHDSHPSPPTLLYVRSTNSLSLFRLLQKQYKVRGPNYSFKRPTTARIHTRAVLWLTLLAVRCSLFAVIFSLPCSL